jgi:glycosyltransferase involved in cell wall biosynthesis
MFPKVSVIISTYNRLKFLKLSLDSVLNQTFTDFEVIVIDDGSKGDENEKWCSKFNKVRYYKIPHSGTPSKTRNVGIDKANGNYIGFLDDDDLWELNRLELMVTILDNNPKFGLVHAYCSIIDENGKAVNKIVGKPGRREDKHGDVKYRMLGNWTISDYPIIRNETLKEIGYFNEEMLAAGEDVEFWARASFFTNFYFLDLPLTKYRVHSGSNSKLNKKLYIKLNLKLNAFLKRFLEKGILTKQEYKKCNHNLVKNQIKLIKQDVFKSLTILSKLDSLWFFKYSNIKLLIFITLKK